MIRVLITGASGYVGRAFLTKAAGLKITSIDRVIDNSVRSISNSFIQAELSELSENQKDSLRNFEGIVIHLAAARSDEETQYVYERDNITATAELLNSLDGTKISKFIHVSSVAALDGELLAKNDLVPSNSDDWYRLTKYRQQALVGDWCQRMKVPLIILAPSAIYDANASKNSTNIGRLEKAISKLRVAPKIDVLKSLTAMELMVEAISSSIFQFKKSRLEKFIVIDRPTRTVTEICLEKFNAKIVVKIPFLKFLLLYIAFILRCFRLDAKIPLTRDRIFKLYKPTNYLANEQYKDWVNEKLKPN